MVNCGGTVQLSGAVRCYVPAPLSTATYTNSFSESLHCSFHATVCSRYKSIIVFHFLNFIYCISESLSAVFTDRKVLIQEASSCEVSPHASALARS